jgi:hypothetical protein
VLPRRLSLLVAALSAVAPVFAYSSFVMTENVAYPLCLLSAWAMMAAVRSPSARTDAAVLASIVVATAARIQLVALIPVAVTAFVLAALLDREAEEGLARALARCWRGHRLFFSAVGLLLVGAGLVAVAGNGIFSLAGGYSAVGHRGFPNVPHLLKLIVQHTAGVVFAAGVVPFVGSLVAAYVFVRLRLRRPYVPFAAVSVALTAWLLLEAAFQAAQFDSGPNANVPRIHERFFVYITPLFLVGVVAVWRSSQRAAVPRGVFLAAAAVAVLFAALIPYGTVINNTVAFESIGLQLFARVPHGQLTALSHATLYAVWLAGTLALLYSRVASRLRPLLVLIVAPFIFTWFLEMDRIEGSSSYARGLLPEHVDWVDRAQPAGDVIVITARRPTVPELETTFGNLSVDRVYYACRPAFGNEFGEQRVTISQSGRLREAGGYVKARYVVAPASLEIRGRVVARNRPGQEALVAPADGLVRVAPSERRSLNCN